MSGAAQILAPLAIEAATLRRAVPRGWVRVIGMGPTRAAAGARAVAGEPPAPVAVIGTAGALVGDLAPGTLVVASEVRAPDGAVYRLSAAGPLVAALRRRGLPVRYGGVASAHRVVRRAARADHAMSGALVVDTESAWVAEALADRPLVVLRAVADTPGRELPGVRAALAGARALASLRRAAPAVREWVAAAAPRRLLLDERSVTEESLRFTLPKAVR